ncbi:hypothetical protein Zmor_017521 [Zophobas morio]|uniref:Uncharacterized protein n=1 Tax=Zophobas morio TaxID=2755281 RepID=A0AA38I921_9CUCU|nr:hypothetical protein Zmor_017521 [Zophobas morio]
MFHRFQGKFKEAPEAGFFIAPAITRWSTTVVHVTMKSIFESTDLLNLHLRIGSVEARPGTSTHHCLV